MTTLSSDFEGDLREAILDDVEATVAGEDDGLDLEAIARENFQSYAAKNDYQIDHIWKDAEKTVNRHAGGVTLRVEWPGLTNLFEFGVPPFTLHGDPLHFYWEAKDQWIKTDSVNWGSETGGIPESRAIRDAMNTVRANLQS